MQHTNTGGMGMRKHGKGGTPSAPKVSKVITCRDLNKSRDEEAERRKKRRGETYDSVEHLMQNRR